MKCKLFRPMACDRCPEFPDGVKPAGTVIDHPQAWIQVRAGNAEPADAECEARAGMNAEAARQAAQSLGARRLAAGIHPHDFWAFDAGIMLGYGPHHTDDEPDWIPGPNYDAWIAEQEAAAEEAAAEESAA